MGDFGRKFVTVHDDAKMVSLKTLFLCISPRKQSEADSVYGTNAYRQEPKQYVEALPVVWIAN